MKKSLMVLAALTLFTTQLYAKSKDCSLYVYTPRITHSMYGENTGNNKVNAGVISILQKNGFTISTNSSKARYAMETEVRCSKMWTFFGLQDACQTEVTFTDTKEEKVVFTDGPTIATPGLNIDFNSVRFPTCNEL
jgi:hypothetical protein